MDDALGASAVVSDPFSGGGTVAIEASRRGHAMYAQDLHPWAITGLRSALEDVDPDELERAGRALLEALEEERWRLYGTTCPEHPAATSEIATALWVRRASCPACEAAVHLFPYSYISRASRGKDETHGWFGCPGCGQVKLSSLSAADRRCGNCKRRLGGVGRALMPGRRACCVDRDCRTEFDPWGQPAAWSLALVQRRCVHENKVHLHLAKPTDAEREQALPAVSAPGALRASIPTGIETAVLRRAGFSSWASLYPSRQLKSLLAAINGIDSLRTSAPVKSRLRLAVCGAGEMAGYLSRWDRHYPKAYEAVANHRFAVTGLSAEVNLFSDTGRGILKRRFAASVKAARWRRENLPRGMALRRRSASGARLAPAGITLVHGSSERQLARTETVDLVLTDPPYFDDVQYAELAGLFLAWARGAALIADSVELELASEAVANTKRGTGVEEYRMLLAGILSETARSLKQDGRMILTFHNTDLRAWWALGRALVEAGFGVRALAVAFAENDADHSKRGRRGFMHDLVLECKRGNRPGPLAVVEPGAGDAHLRELIAAGRAVAAMAPGETLEIFRTRYLELRGRLEEPRISAGSGGTGNA